MEEEDSTPGEPSRRPVPTRTLANPSRLTVAHPSSSTAQPDESNDTDAETFKQTLIHRAKITKKGERWSDKLMESAVDLQTFKKALAFLTPQQYRDVLHERHLANHCSYPPCAKASKAPYTSRKRFKISYNTRTIREKEGNEDEGFCSAQHRVQSEWVEKKLSEVSLWDRAGREGIELLEDLEVTTPKQQPSSPQIGPARLIKPSVGSKSTEPQGLATPTNGLADPRVFWKERIQAIAQDVPPGSASQSNVTDMISSLTIHERPTPASADPLVRGEEIGSAGMAANDPAASSALQAAAQTSSAGTSTRRAATSLVSTPNKLSATVLSASRQMGAIPQLAPDSDEEEQDGDWGETDMGLAWGEETDEMRALFEEARQARELLEEAEDGK